MCVSRSNESFLFFYERHCHTFLSAKGKKVGGKDQTGEQTQSSF